MSGRLRLDVLALSLAMLVGCQSPWKLDFVNDGGVSLIVRVVTAEESASWAAANGQVLTLMHSAFPQRGQVLLLDPATCRILDAIDLPAASSTLFVGWDLDTGDPDFIVADGAGARDPDPPSSTDCPVK